MKKFLTTIKSLLLNIWSIIDKKIVMPASKLILVFRSKFDKQGKQIENWLSKPNTILYISLFLALLIFIVVDQKVLTFSESSAEVLKSQPVMVVYNEEAYVIEGLPKTVDITLIGSKADLYFAKQSPSHDVTIDLSNLKPGTHKVSITYNQALPSIKYTVNPSVATVIIYPKISKTKTLTVDLLNQDSLNERLVIKNVDIDNDNVVIKGAEYKLNKVATVKALIDIKNLVTQEIGVNLLKDIPLKAYDESGNVVDVEIVPSKINSNIEIASPTKEIPIKVVPSGTVSFGKAISAIVTNVTSVTVYGDEAALSSLKYIEVPVDVEGLNSNSQYKLELNKPVGVKSMSVNNVTVNVTLGNSAVRDISGVRIDYRNLKDGYKVQGISAFDVALTVSVKGVESVINQITAENIVAYLDLSGYGEGEHSVDVQIEKTDAKVEYVPKTTKVNIRIISE